MLSACWFHLHHRSGSAVKLYEVYLQHNSFSTLILWFRCGSQSHVRSGCCAGERHIIMVTHTRNGLWSGAVQRVNLLDNMSSIVVTRDDKESLFMRRVKNETPVFSSSMGKTTQNQRLTQMIQYLIISYKLDNQVFESRNHNTSLH